MKLPAPITQRLVAVVCFASLSWLGAAVRGDDAPGITVTGTGVAEALPDVVELTATVEGTAELAYDAMQKFRGNKNRVVTSLGGLKIDGLGVADAGPSINSGTPANPLVALQGQANQPKVADKVSVQENLLVTISGIDKMEADAVLQAVTRVVDVAKDAGVAMGPEPMNMVQVQLRGAKPAALATFKLTNADTLREQAYAAALGQARGKAEQLAKLAGVSLGDIISVRETQPIPKDDDKSGGMATYFALIAGAAGGKQPEFSAAAFHDIPVTVTLEVQFAIAGKE